MTIKERLILYVYLDMYIFNKILPQWRLIQKLHEYTTVLEIKLYE